MSNIGFGGRVVTCPTLMVSHCSSKIFMLCSMNTPNSLPCQFPTRDLFYFVIVMVTCSITLVLLHFHSCCTLEFWSLLIRLANVSPSVNCCGSVAAKYRKLIS